MRVTRTGGDDGRTEFEGNFSVRDFLLLAILAFFGSVPAWAEEQALLDIGRILRRLIERLGDGASTVYQDALDLVDDVARAIVTGTGSIATRINTAINDADAEVRRVWGQITRIIRVIIRWTLIFLGVNAGLTFINVVVLSPLPWGPAYGIRWFVFLVQAIFSLAMIAYGGAFSWTRAERGQTARVPLVWRFLEDSEDETARFNAPDLVRPMMQIGAWLSLACFSATLPLYGAWAYFGKFGLLALGIAIAFSSLSFRRAPGSAGMAVMVIAHFLIFGVHGTGWAMNAMSVDDDYNQETEILTTEWAPVVVEGLLAGYVPDPGNPQAALILNPGYQISRELGPVNNKQILSALQGLYPGEVVWYQAYFFLYRENAPPRQLAGYFPKRVWSVM